MEIQCLRNQYHKPEGQRACGQIQRQMDDSTRALSRTQLNNFERIQCGRMKLLQAVGSIPLGKCIKYRIWHPRFMMNFSSSHLGFNSRMMLSCQKIWKQSSRSVHSWLLRNLPAVTRWLKVLSSPLGGGVSFRSVKISPFTFKTLSENVN